MKLQPGCQLCDNVGGRLIARADRWRVVRADEPSFPAFYRVIWNEHRAEFTDLSVAERSECMEVVCAIESVLRETLQPRKVNLASFGNIVAHVHWHVIARFDWDSHFPQPIWGDARRAVEPPAETRLATGLETLDQTLAQRLEHTLLSPSRESDT